MSKTPTKEELENLLSNSIQTVSDYLTTLSNEKSVENKKRSMLISYWLIDYIRLLKNEKNFVPHSLLKYRRGDILSVNFGFRIGSELGGRHFAIVLDNFNNKKSNLITVLPLTSLKGEYKDNIYTHLLNKGLCELQNEKYNKQLNDCKKSLLELLNKLSSSENMSDTQAVELSKKIQSINKNITELESLKESTLHLKDGSIANIGQITTISKQRILNPKKTLDTLNNIKITNEDLDAINKKILYLYSFQEKKEENPFLKNFIGGLNR